MCHGVENYFQDFKFKLETEGRRYIIVKWAQEDVETLYNLLNK